MVVTCSITLLDASLPFSLPLPHKLLTHKSRLSFCRSANEDTLLLNLSPLAQLLETRHLGITLDFSLSFSDHNQVLQFCSKASLDSITSLRLHGQHPHPSNSHPLCGPAQEGRLGNGEVGTHQ